MKQLLNRQTREGGKRPFFLIASLLFALLLVGLPQTAHASCGGTTSVSNTNQLNNAITAFNNASSGCGTFTVVFTADITLSENMERINNSDANTTLVIDGAGFELNGDNQRRLLVRINRGTVEINNLYLVNGKEAGVWVDNNGQVTLDNVEIADSGTNGVRVRSDNGKATIKNSVITNSDLSGVNLSKGEVIVEKSAITYNDEHGIYTEGESKIRVEYSLVAYNSAQGVRSRNGQTKVVSSTILNNGGSGLSNGGTSTTSQLKVHNSTIALNTGSGITRLNGPLEVIHSTIVENGDDGIDIANGQDVDIYNTILHSNGQMNCRKRNNPDTFNLINTIVGRHKNCDSSYIIRDNPELDSYTSPDDLTLIYPLKSNSPAIDGGYDPAVDDMDDAIEDYDQRGEGFDRIVGNNVDIGAVEMQSSELSGTAVSASTTTNLPLILALGGILLLGMVGLILWQRRA